MSGPRTMRLVEPVEPERELPLDYSSTVETPASFAAKMARAAREQAEAQEREIQSRRHPLRGQR